MDYETVEQIYKDRHRTEESIYDCFNRQMGGVRKVDDDLLKDTYLAARLVENPALYVYMEEVFGGDKVVSVRKDAYTDFEMSYYSGIASYFQGLYLCEEPVGKKKLFDRAVKNLGTVISDVDGGGSAVKEE